MRRFRNYVLLPAALLFVAPLLSIAQQHTPQISEDEIANRQQPTASALCQELGLDPGYLSRILSKLGVASRAQVSALLNNQLEPGP